MSAFFSDNPLWFNLFFAAEWMVRLAMLIIVPMRRSPEAAKGWLLLIFFEPSVGLALYLLIGRPTLPKWRLARQTEFDELSRPHYARLASEPNIFRPDVGPTINRAVTLAENLGELPILGGNSAEILAVYETTVDRIIADIDAAHDHVHLLFYIIADDATSERVMAALKRAVGRGVNCRVLADSLGSRPEFRRMLPRLHRMGILAAESMRLGFFGRTGRLDLRNHRKLVVVDGRIGYTGSQNLVDSTFKKGLDYEELNVRLTGPVVLELQAVFAEDWYTETGEFLGDPRYFPEPQVGGDVAAQVLPSGPGYPRENNQRLIVSLIHAASRRIVITMPYLIPDDALHAGAADRGAARRRGDAGGSAADGSVPRVPRAALVLRRAARLRRSDLPLRQALPAREAPVDRRQDRVDRLVESRHPLLRAQRGNHRALL